MFTAIFDSIDTFRRSNPMMFLIIVIVLIIILAYTCYNWYYGQSIVPTMFKSATTSTETLVKHLANKGVLNH